MIKVSIVVPNYNHAKYLSTRLDSIINQTFRDFELIILDDASTDQSRDVILPYLSDPRVQFHPNSVNSGSAFIQWNRGVGLAKGEFVWIAESDDVASPDFLATLVPMLEEDPRAGVAYCQSWRMDECGNVVGTLEESTAVLFPGRWKAAFRNNGPHECANYLLWKNTLPNASAVLFRRDIYSRAGGAPAELRLCGDWLAWVRMLQVSDVMFTPECLNYFRHHPFSVRETTKSHRFLDEKWKVQREVLHSCHVSRSARRTLALEVCREHRHCLRNGSIWQYKWDLLRKVRTFVRFFSMAPVTILRAYLRKMSSE